MSLPAEWQAEIERYVRPLYAGLDGVDGYPAVERLERRLDELAEGTACDRELVSLLAVFQGVLPRLGSLTAGGRWHLFLKGVGLPEATIARLRAALGRLEAAPVGIEEELLQDALLLERTGVRAAVEALWQAGRKRTAVDRAVGALDAGPGEERFHTPNGRRIAARRFAAATAFIADLRSALDAER